ncbi:MAG TPA: hypothetical protein VLJ17_11485 [Xanthobacteraceae bacterium]|nr:hypothetical protein [Xanthobacteraceae bacterium]
MTRTELVLMALTTALLLPAPSAHAGCIGHRVFAVPNGVTNVEGGTRAGQPCEIAFGLGGDIEALQIIVRPSHGVVGTSAKEGNRRYIAYVPSAGFVGSDRFEADVRYRPPGRTSSLMTRYKVEMHVTP